MILLVNKDHIFDEKYLDDIELVKYENYKEDLVLVESETYIHFLDLQFHLKLDDIIIDIKDAYRSLERQESIFLRYMNKYGIDEAENMVSMPGYSEHETGTAIDIALFKDDRWIDSPEELFKEEKIFKKIHSCLYNYGFILRYPMGKEEITGSSYKPWHIRYVGKEAWFLRKKVLEEYLMGEDGNV